MRRRVMENFSQTLFCQRTITPGADVGYRPQGRFAHFSDGSFWYGQYRRCLILSRRLQAVRVCNVREGSVSKARFGQGSLVVWRDLIERNPIFMFEERHA